MSLLLKNAHVVDPASSGHDKKLNLLIENGKITSLQGSKAVKEVDLEGKIVFPGWFDFNAHFNDPGLEYKEDIDSGCKTASLGGFTDVQVIPNTSPPLETKSDVKYVLHRASPLVDLHISAALSENLNGENLTEIFDLKHSGAGSFSDGDNPIWNAKLLLKALQYTSPLNVPIIQFPRDRSLSENTHMHEGKVSTLLGLRGEPALSEELMVMRDLEILKYSGGRIHFSRVSSAKSVERIRKAKQEGQHVTCDTSIHQLLFTDEAATDFDTNFKNLPPFRMKSDREELISGIKDGSIDVICSNHRPQDRESKHLEFDLAEPGSISLQTFYSSLLKLSKVISWETLIQCISWKPREILGLEPCVIQEGASAKLTIVDPDANWVLDDETNVSKSKNSPFFGENLKGRVIGVVNRESYEFFK